MEAESLRVAMFSTMLGRGGAGYAALRVHDSLRLAGADCTLYVGAAERSRLPGVHRLSDAVEGIQPRRVPGLTIFSSDPPGIPKHTLDEIIGKSDLFNLHWYARFLSLRNIARLSWSGKPVVITVRDMNPLSGGCHFFHGCDNWQSDCAPCPQFIPDTIPLPGATLDAKKTLWNFDNITVVALSDHTASLLQRSPLFAHCRVEKIPNPIDVSIFKPHDRSKARATLGIPSDKHAIAYLPSFSSSVKGASQAIEALKCLSRDVPAADCVIICAGDLEKPLDVPFETIDVGFIADKHQLARYYSAVDVTLVPSTEETFSNTAAESVACGTPVVGFQVGAVPEIAQGERGQAVPVGDIKALANALRMMISDAGARSEDLHRYVVESFGAEAIGRRYLELFGELHRNGQACAASACSKITHSSRLIQDFDRVLNDFGSLRRGQLSEERQARRREMSSIRGCLNLILRAVALFFTDNKAFRRQVQRLVEDGR